MTVTPDLPLWTIRLSERHRTAATHLLTDFTIDADERARRLDHLRQMCDEPAYQIVRLAFGGLGLHLEPKPINLPAIPAANNEPEPDWHRQIHEYCNDGHDSEHDWSTLHADCQRYRVEDWEKTVRAFEANPNDFYNAWHYLDNHPAFWRFQGADKRLAPTELIHERRLRHERRLTESVDIDVVKVNPNSQRHEDDNALNTQTQVWVEMGKWSWPEEITDSPNTWERHYHDPDLDCGADTIEEAIITAAIYLHTCYGNDRVICDKPYVPEEDTKEE
jgi:hypothetical protein